MQSNRVDVPLETGYNDDYEDRVYRCSLTPDKVYDMIRSNDIGLLELVLINGWLLAYLNGDDMNYKSDFCLTGYIDDLIRIAKEDEWLSDVALTLLNGCSLVEHCESVSRYGIDVDILDVEFVNGESIYNEYYF